MASQHFDHSFGGTAPENYERFFVPVIGKPLAEDLLRKADPRPGERVLDVGCGTGVVARLAAEKVGGEGRVAGVDVNPGMIAVARAVTPSELGIEWREASADALPFPERTFDVVLCQLALQFIPERGKALREMHRALTPGGRLFLNVPGPADRLFQALAEAMRQHISSDAAGFVEAVFALHDELELQQLLDQAGFREVEVEVEVRDLTLPGAREFLWQYVASTPLSGAIAHATEAALSALEADVLEKWSEFEEAGAMPYRQRIVTGSGWR